MTSEFHRMVAGIKSSKDPVAEIKFMSQYMFLILGLPEEQEDPEGETWKDLRDSGLHHLLLKRCMREKPLSAGLASFVRKQVYQLCRAS